jgi:hypothetical protein
MLRNDPNYRRLKVGGIGLMSASSFWLGQDHLLIVEVSNYVENYRRFYFQDVQAVIIQETRTRLWLSIGLALGALFLVVLFILQQWGLDSPNLIAAGIFLGLAGLTGVLLLLNFAGGPSCAVKVQTAVQTQRLPNLRRRRKAAKLLEALEPLIVAAQSAPAAPAPAAAAETPSEPPAS